jgi:hypothetical protein
MPAAAKLALPTTAAIMGKILLLTLQARLVGIDDSHSTYKHFVSPSTSRDLPIRQVPFSSDLSSIGSDDFETSRAMRRCGLRNMSLRFACDPAVEGVICGPMIQEIKDLRQRNASLKHQLQIVRQWAALPWWKKTTYWIRGMGLVDFAGM